VNCEIYRNVSSIISTIIIILSIIAMPGCSVLSPYNTEFKCPDSYKGTCNDVTSSYKDSLASKDDVYSKQHRKSQGDKEDRIKGNSTDDTCETCNKSSDCTDTKCEKITDQYENLYKKSLYTELKTLIDEPKTPVIQPPKVMRVLLLGYTDTDNQYLSHRYMYLIVTDPKWIISPVEEAKQ
jgi:conjugal transfer pilus assembly protein TraV